MRIGFDELDRATEAAIDRQNELMERRGYKATQISRSLIREAIRAALVSLLREPITLTGHEQGDDVP